MADKLKWSYKKAIEYIAFNDNETHLFEKSIENYISTKTLSAASGKTIKEIARDVYILRRKNKK